MKMTFAVTLGGAILVFLVVVMAVVFIPGWVWNPPPTAIAHPYTPEQERGRILFYSNGCNYCHTQYVRYYDTGLGPVSEGGNYIYDNPMILGSERTGPDLSYIGRKRDEAWEIEHWKNPRELSPLSIMPSFEFLSDDDLHAMAAYLFNLGDRTAAEWMIIPNNVDYASITQTQQYPLITLTQQDQGWESWNAAGLQEGKTIYITRCQTCHGCAGNGLGTYGGTKIVTPADYKVEPFSSMTDAQWFWHVSEGIQGTVMPPWKESLTSDERWLVIRYIQQEFAHPVERDPAEGDPPATYASTQNPVPLTVAALENGKHIFIRECMVCHGDAGKGHGPYRAGLLPQPPDFSDKEHYATFAPIEYFWRISEGLPWSAMTIWKERYSEEDRWDLTHYIMVNFTQTEARPQNAPAQVYPANYLALQKPTSKSLVDVFQDELTHPIPVTPNAENGRSVYLKQCAHCHGLTGVGDGWDGAYLDVKPANFTGEMVRGLSDGDWYARVSEGMQNSAMPTWGEWLPDQYRWDVIDFIQTQIVANAPASNANPQNTPTLASVDNGKVAANFVTLSMQDWLDEGNPISPDNGKTLYGQYCAECHGNDFKGQGPGTVQQGIPSPAALPASMSEPYIYWRMWEGVPNTLMYPFSNIITTADAWDILAYLETSGIGPQPSGDITAPVTPPEPIAPNNIAKNP